MIDTVYLKRRRASDGSQIFSIVLKQPFETDYEIDCQSEKSAEKLATTFKKETGAAIIRWY